MPDDATDPKPATEEAATPAPPAAHVASHGKGGGGFLKWIILLLVIAAAIVFGVPAVKEALTTVSTDDAYVNGHVTFVAPRVGGQVTKVLVDDNNRVHKGDLLVELDKEPYRVQVEIRQAALDAAQADAVATEASVRGAVAKARSLRYKLQHAIEDVDSQAVLLRARVAALEQSKASLALAETELARSKSLRASNAVSQQDLDQHQETQLSAQAQYNSALQSIYETRVNLGLPPQPANVQVGQSLMAVRSLTEIWVDANFKETQLGRLRIGLPVDVHVDMYGKHRVFQGRISGFTMGTGSTLALLPAQNATGNFIKVVQRLPVRIDLTDYDPEKDALFVGLSVEPEVRINEQPRGPNAGKFFQPEEAAAPAAPGK